MPLVTVVIAAYNRSHLLKYAIKSVLNQEFQDFEIQVVGDCCTDDSEQVVLSFGDPRIHWTNLKKRTGTQSGPNNEGIQRAQGKYIAYLGQDDLWFPWHLIRLVEMLNSGIEFATSLHTIIAPNDVIFIGKRNRIKQHLPFPGCWIHTRKVVEQIGNWRCDTENLDTPIDIEFSQRLLEHEGSYGELDEISAIKFPSPLWKPYASNAVPQATYFHEILQDPVSLHLKLLKQCFLEKIKPENCADLPFRFALKNKLLKTFGPFIPFLRQIRKMHNQREIERLKILRGLTQEQSPAPAKEKGPRV